jgi:hypothetical protein
VLLITVLLRTTVIKHIVRLRTTVTKPTDLLGISVVKLTVRSDM